MMKDKNRNALKLRNSPNKEINQFMKIKIKCKK